MNILLVTPFHLSGTGGVCTTVRMLSKEFHRQGHQVSILTPGTSTQVLSLNNGEGASVYGIYLRHPFIEGALLRGFVAFWMRLPFTLYELYYLTTQKKIDVVAIQYPMPWVFYFAILRYICRWKLVITFQGNDAHDLPLLNWTDRLFVKWLLKASDRVSAVSRSLLNEVRLTFPNLSLKTCIIPNGAPVEIDCRASSMELLPGVPREYILTVGQLIPRKGVDLLIKALKIVRDSGSLLQLVVVGEGSERANLLQLAQEAGLSDNVYFVGNQSHEKTLEFFKNCLFFVLASRAEGLPLVIVEALAHGKAVIATDVDGVSEIIQDGHNGILVKPEEPQALAQALIKLQGEPALRHELGSCGREQVLREYSWETIGMRYLSIFEDP